MTALSGQVSYWRNKICVVFIVIHNVIPFDHEAWTSGTKDIQILEVFDHWLMRQILKINWRGSESDKDVRRHR